MFAAKKGTNYDGLNIPTLPPAIYKGGELKDVKKDRTTPKDGGEGTAILTYTLEFPEGSHQVTEYDIKADAKDAEKKADNMVKRLGHVLRQFGIPQETIDANSSTTFTQLQDWFMSTLGQAHVGVKSLELKVVGSVYNGTAKSEIPGYIPFLANTARQGYKPLSFSASEISNNNAYKNHTNATPDAESSGSGNPSTGLTPNSGVDTDF